MENDWKAAGICPLSHWALIFSFFLSWKMHGAQHFEDCVLLGNAQTEIVYCSLSKFYHQERWALFKNKIKKSKSFSFKCNALTRSIFATCARQTERSCNNGGSLVITVNLTKSEINFCFLHAAPEGKCNYHLAMWHLAVGPILFRQPISVLWLNLFVTSLKTRFNYS